ncbi:pyrroline-5-carboxylate reductase [SAR202 cluster bacterium AC-409-J13_OGT_754m]|nr:pyrroline-5-carboxylate reductase [SAR202 cluster bacterium AC-409-J13_OGT_754m]
MKLAFIGGGVMAQGLIKGVLDSSLAKPSDISVGEIDQQKCSELSKRYGVMVDTNNTKVVENGELIILAVKPQNLSEVASQINGMLTADQTVISVIAGARISTLVELLGHQPVIRVMPNTPAQIGKGMILWMCSKKVKSEVAKKTQSMLKTLGVEIQIHDEQYLDMATALSASGPAYVFTFIEALVDAGVFIGLPRHMAKELTLQTVLGSTQLAIESGKHTAELRDMVASPGGTTVEALLALEEGEFRSTVMNAVIAAYEKSLSLGGE